MSPPSLVPSNHAGVQVLRFLAALLVVAEHLPGYLHDRIGAPFVEVPTGLLGVAVFFAISGFVAVLVTHRTPPPTWRRFLGRRLTRIVPLAWTVMTVKLLVLLIAPGVLERASTAPVHIALSYVFLPGRGADGLVQPLHTVTWTLSFELLFYAVVTVALAARVDPFRLASVVFVALAVGSAARAPHGWPSWQFHADRLVLCFLVGMAVGAWALDRRARTAVFRIAAVTALWLVVGTAAHASVGALALLPVAAVVLAVTVAAEPVVGHRVGRLGATLGDASYALYLTHPFVAPATVAVVATVTAEPSPSGIDIAAAATAAVLTSVGVSVAVWFGVDRPVTRVLQRRWTPVSAILTDTSVGRN